jgi:hypothetical protein
MNSRIDNTFAREPRLFKFKLAMHLNSQSGSKFKLKLTNAHIRVLRNLKRAASRLRRKPQKQMSVRCSSHQCTTSKLRLQRKQMNHTIPITTQVKSFKQPKINRITEWLPTSNLSIHPLRTLMLQSTLMSKMKAHLMTLK